MNRSAQLFSAFNGTWIFWTWMRETVKVCAYDTFGLNVTKFDAW